MHYGRRRVSEEREHSSRSSEPRGSKTGKALRVGDAPFYVYILECADKTLYVGYTKDIARRLKTHNSGKAGAKYTKSRRPVVLRYKEGYRTLSKALKREHELKQWSRREKLSLVCSKRAKSR